jgi:hypothetical protein
MAPARHSTAARRKGKRGSKTRAGGCRDQRQNSDNAVTGSWLGSPPREKEHHREERGDGHQSFKSPLVGSRQPKSRSEREPTHEASGPSPAEPMVRILFPPAKSLLRTLNLSIRPGAVRAIDSPCLPLATHFLRRGRKGARGRSSRHAFPLSGRPSRGSVGVVRRLGDGVVAGDWLRPAGGDLAY